MKHHEDPFFESVRNELYAMEVAPPAGIQGKVMARVQPARSPWLMNSVAALLICAAGVGIASWQHTTAECTAKRSYEAEPVLDAALSNAQARIVERESIAEDIAQETRKQSSPQRMAIAPAARRQAMTVAPATEPGVAISAAEQPSCELPKSSGTSSSTPAQHITRDDQTATQGLNAADILKQAENADGDVIRMSVKVTVPVDDKE